MLSARTAAMFGARHPNSSNQHRCHPRQRAELNKYANLGPSQWLIGATSATNCIIFMISQLFICIPSYIHVFSFCVSTLQRICLEDGTC